MNTETLESINSSLLKDERRAPRASKSPFWDHFRAILFRRIVLFKRSWKTTVVSSIATIFFTSLAIVAQYLISTLAYEENTPITFNSFKAGSDEIPLVGSEEMLRANSQYIDTIRDIYVNDTGREPVFLNFSTPKELNDFVYRNEETKTGTQSFPMGFHFNGTNGEINVFFNGTVRFQESNLTQPLFAEMMVTRVKWLKSKKHDFRLSFVVLLKRMLEKVFSSIGPMLIAGGMLSTIPILISQPVIDNVGEVRQYMVSCTLTLFPYWLATFVLDLLLYLIISTLVWAMFMCAQIAAFLDNAFITWYTLAMCGPAFIIFLYCISFFFDSPESASRDGFIILCLLLIVPTVTDMVRDFEPNPVWYDWVLALLPSEVYERILIGSLAHMGFLVEPFSFYWKEKNQRPFYIMQIGNIFIYSIILCIIESVRLHIRSNSAKSTFGNYTDIFKKEKAKHPVTQEAKDMEALVESDNSFAVRILNASRLFFNTANKPITAVNGVSLGVRRNSIFGFLGANGAGKTTLIKMITSMLPPSDGVIEINGRNIEEYNDPTLLSICPQFNNHLCEEMTPREHFHLYSMIHHLDKQTELESTEKLIRSMEMEHLADTPLRELSGGDQRKLAIALSFLGPAEIILLDEPTASLDPVARHKVHDMILSYKGTKTFMLCTHLLSEAEFLCDMISIMVKGCVYTCGTSQYLTQKFGTDFKIDVMLADESIATEQKCDNFFKTRLPSATLSIKRPKARIYSIPAADQPLSQLFRVMQEGEDGDSGITYFTCSSSSLERVFMEIIRMSESDDIVVVEQNP